MAKTNKHSRAKRRQEKIGVDALTICFKTEDFVFDKIKDGDDLLWWGEDGCADFFTYRIDKESDDRMQLLNINIPHDKETRLLGTLRIYHSTDKKNGGRAFMAIENKALYDDFLMNLIGYVAGVMLLEYNNITKLDLALTSTYNYISAIMKCVRNFTGMEMIYNRKNIKNPYETLKNFTDQAGHSRFHRLNNPTLYFGQKKGNGIRVKVYDKEREMIDQSPEKAEYLYDWLGFRSDSLFRIELSLTNPEVRELCSLIQEYRQEWGHNGNLINLLNLPSFLEIAFCTTLSRVLHFRKGRQVIDIWDL